MHDPAAGAGHQVADERGEGVDAALLGVADVDGLRVVALHEGHEPRHQVRHVLEGPRLLSGTVDCDGFVLQRLKTSLLKENLYQKVNPPE